MREALLRAEVARLEVLDALGEYNSQLETLLTTYRRQRAWKVMVWLRKAYTLLTRKGKLALLRHLASTPFTGGHPLEPHEPEFPALNAYLPPEVRKPFTPQPLSAEVVNEVRVRRRITAIAGASRYDIVLLPVFPFDFRFQRPQQLAVHFARAGHRVFWLCPASHLDPDSPIPYRLLEREKNLWEVHLRGHHYDFHQDVAGAEAAAAMLGSLERLYAECAIAEACAIVQWPAWSPVACALRERFGTRLLYDCMDDWDTFPEVGQVCIAEERRLIQAADAFVVTAERLRTKFASLEKPVTVIRNATDFDFFQRAGEEDPLPDISRPVVGYFGAIADWTDLDLVAHAARRRSKYSFVILGQNHGQDLSRLEALRNVKILGQRPYGEMPKYLRAFDVCLIPFRLSDITHATDPVKLYEYFSLGKPVVATAMQELAAFGDLLYRAAGRHEFTRRIDEAVAESDPEIRRRRIEFARANTWNVRVEAMKTEIEKTFPLVSILVVTHNSRAFVKPCFDSLLRHTLWPNYEIVAVDNASTDGTPDLLRARAAENPRVRVFALDRNTGFAGGNNFAARQARGEYLILLNADTMVTAGWVERLVRRTRSDPKAGIVVAVTNFAGNEARIATDYRNQAEMEAFAGEIARSRAGQFIEIRSAPLYCTLVPRAVWQELGELDESFSVGMFEDDDYSLRALKAGYRVVTAEDCFTHHFGQGSFSQLDPGESERIFETNRERFEKKWGEPWQPHRCRPDIRPAHREHRFAPAQFCAPEKPAGQ